MSTQRATNGRQRSTHRRAFRRLRFEPLEGRLALAILTVNSLNDGPVNLADTTVTLRDAIEAANTDVAASPGGPAGSGPDEIRFAGLVDDTITLNQGQLQIRSNLTITGPGASVLTISANQQSRVFNVDDGVTAERNVTISGLTITDGLAESDSGGGIASTENLTVVDCVITENFAQFSAGIGAFQLTLLNSTVSNNSGIGVDFNSGGGVGARNATIRNSTIVDNGAIFGGGLSLSGESLIENSTIDGNRASTQGGGIEFVGGTLTVRNTTISNNSAGGGGGGIYARGSFTGAITVQNSTISGNLAGSGGGISIDGAELTVLVQNSTITQNHSDRNDTNPNDARSFGGGIRIASGTVALHNTIVADNFRGSGTTKEENIGAESFDANLSGTNNLIGTGNSGGFTNGTSGNKVGVGDPKLGPLADNGGSTKTHALLGGSPASDAGRNEQAPSFSTFDQRGTPFLRIASGKVDIGAFEAQPISLVVDTDVDEDDGNYGAGDLSLREAINRTNANGGADTITFAAGFFSTPRTIPAGFLITDNLTIIGPGANLLSIDGNNSTPIFEVNDNNPDNKLTVSMSGLTMMRGGGVVATGAGIRNFEKLTVERSVVRDCVATGIDAGPFGKIFGTGGGISNGGDLTVVNSTISGNQSTFSGGGIHSEAGTLLVLNSSISGNRSGDSGGGIFASGPLTVQNSTIASNRADSDADGAGSQGGGGIRISDVTATLHNTIVLANTRNGGGTPPIIFVFNDDISVDSGGGVNGTSRNNLIGIGGSGGLVNNTNGNQVGVSVANAKVSGLENNGGPTSTHKLLEGSPAIDRGSNGHIAVNISTDQRGFARIFNDTIDIGAFEVQPDFPWHNFSEPFDVRGGSSVAPDGEIDAGDALAIINYLNAVDFTEVPDDAVTGLPFGFLDTNMDNNVAPDDVLEVINAVNAGLDQEPEASQEPGGGGQEPDRGFCEMDDLIGLLAADVAAESGRRRRGT